MDDRLPEGIDEITEDMDEMVEADILTLTSEDGEEFHFELVDRAELDSAEYVALIPLPDEDDEQELDEDVDGELVFMKVVMDGDEEFLESIEGDEEFERVSEFFTERLSEFFEIE